MRRVSQMTLTLILLLFLFPLRVTSVHASTTEPALLIGQIKVTSSGGQFVSLYNNSDIPIHMDNIQLAYYNNYELSKSTSSKLIALSGDLQPHNYYLVSDGKLFICYKMIINAATLGFSTTSGMVQVLSLAQGAPGGQVSSTLMDWVAWSKSPAPGAQTLPSVVNGFLERVWPSGTAKLAGGGSWQQASASETDACDLQAQILASTTPAAGNTPPAVKAAAAETKIETNQNSGLVAPELTELFPNPASPQTDDNDEFIELYNPNTSAYDLAGYRLEAGTSYSRGYTFEEGIIAPKSYAAFPITQTSLQLSNSKGQVRLLDKEGTTISETAGYEDAPSGSSWSLVSDSWQWTDVPTPAAVNTPSEEKKDSEESSTETTTKKVAGSKVAGVGTGTGSSPNALEDAAPLHPMVLAGVGLGAVAYALYEYRQDMANRFFQLRRYLRTRRAVRARL